tara:strand:- start:30004 stop:31242 length:1239 start_codon:yes stop_codon:yes gene_type:complete
MAIQKILSELESKLEGNYPFHHPQYAGQMLKPPHPVAWLAYTLAMTINPNNHALDGGPPTSAMEKECIKKLADMIGYREPSLGHLTSTGTIANLEALFVARESHPGKSIAATSNAHYTHRRMCKVLNTDFLEVPVDADGVPDLNFIKNHSDKIGTLVVTMGTTGLGIVEPLQKIKALADEYHFRIHADAAYGGFFKLIGSELASKADWDVLESCDSVVIDPHKHGLQPYGCGSVIYKDPSVGTFFKHDSPYTYFTSDELHLGEISLECSRAGASAAAFWATLELLPLSDTGLGKILLSCTKAAKKFAGLITNQPNWFLYQPPQLDIVGYFKMPEIKNISELNRINREIFQKGMSDKKDGFHLSLFSIPADQFVLKYPDFNPDQSHATILRSVFLKAEHEDFVSQLANRIINT